MKKNCVSFAGSVGKKIKKTSALMFVSGLVLLVGCSKNESSEVLMPVVATPTSYAVHAEGPAASESGEVAPVTFFYLVAHGTPRETVVEATSKIAEDLVMESAEEALRSCEGPCAGEAGFNPEVYHVVYAAGDLYQIDAVEVVRPQVKISLESVMNSVKAALSVKPGVVLVGPRNIPISVALIEAARKAPSISSDDLVLSSSGKGYVRRPVFGPSQLSFEGMREFFSGFSQGSKALPPKSTANGKIWISGEAAEAAAKATPRKYIYKPPR